MRNLISIVTMCGLVAGFGNAAVMAADNSATVFGAKAVHEALVAITPPGWEQVTVGSPDAFAVPNGVVYVNKSAQTEMEFGHSVAPKAVTAAELLDSCASLGDSCRDCVELQMAPINTVWLGDAMPEARRVLACNQRQAPNDTMGFVELWSFTVRDRDVFYSRFTWFVPPFKAKSVPVTQDELLRGMKMASFWVCDPSGAGQKCPDAVAPIAAGVFRP